MRRVANVKQIKLGGRLDQLRLTACGCPGSAGGSAGVTSFSFNIRASRVSSTGWDLQIDEITFATLYAVLPRPVRRVQNDESEA